MSAIAATPVAANDSVRRGIGSLRTKLLYGFGSVAFGVKDQGFSYFLLFFYNQVVGAPSQIVGRAIAIALFADAFADPVIGQVSDLLMLQGRTGTRRRGDAEKGFDTKTPRALTTILRAVGARFFFFVFSVSQCFTFSFPRLRVSA